MKVRFLGGGSYRIQGKTYKAGKDYEVSDSFAKVLLNKKNSEGFNYFESVSQKNEVSGADAEELDSSDFKGLEDAAENQDKVEELDEDLGDFEEVMDSAEI